MMTIDYDEAAPTLKFYNIEAILDEYETAVGFVVHRNDHGAVNYLIDRYVEDELGERRGFLSNDDRATLRSGILFRIQKDYQDVPEP